MPTGEFDSWGIYLATSLLDDEKELSKITVANGKVIFSTSTTQTGKDQKDEHTTEFTYSYSEDDCVFDEKSSYSNLPNKHWHMSSDSCIDVDGKKATFSMWRNSDDMSGLPVNKQDDGSTTVKTSVSYIRNENFVGGAETAPEFEMEWLPVEANEPDFLESDLGVLRPLQVSDSGALDSIA